MLLPCKTYAFGMQNNRFCKALVVRWLCDSCTCEKYLQNNSMFSRGCWGFPLFEMVGYAVHKWGELSVVGHVVPIAGGERIGYDEAAFGT